MVREQEYYTLTELHSGPAKHPWTIETLSDDLNLMGDVMSSVVPIFRQVQYQLSDNPAASPVSQLYLDFQLRVHTRFVRYNGVEISLHHKTLGIFRGSKPPCFTF